MSVDILTLMNLVDLLICLVVIVSAVGMALHRNLLAAVVFAGVASLAVSYLFLRLAAPDVAMTEAAIGAGLPVGEPVGSMIVDIGGGTTEVAVISLGGICTERSIRVAGEEMDEAIVAYVRRELNLYIGETTAEQIKIQIGSAFPLPDEQTMVIRGKDLVSGLPKSVTLSSGQVREAIREPLGMIVELVKETLDETPPELAADVMNRGIYLAGGVALLRGLDQLLRAETDVPVYVTDDPLTAVVMGTARYLEELDSFPGGA